MTRDAVAAPRPALTIEPLLAPPDASVRLPGSKSITNRALACAAMADGETVIRGALFADDTEAMAAAVAALGARVTADPANAAMTVRGLRDPRARRDPATIDARASGTTGRFIVALAALADRPVVVDGSRQLRDRPFGHLVDALTRLGARAETPSGASLPLRVRGPVRGGVVDVATDASSQFLSGLMLAAPLMPRGLQARLPKRVVSRPYLRMTAAVMRAFGATVEVSGSLVSVPPGRYVSPGVFNVEPDASSASYFWAAAAVTAGTVRVVGLDADSIQGDAAFVSALRRMGASVRHDGGDTIVTAAALAGVDADLSDMSDTAPTLAVVAACARGATTVSGIGFIRGKESDRIAASVAELRRCGVRARELPDGFAVAPDPGAPPHGALVRTYDDHRIAMAFSVLGLKVPGVRIENPACVDKTFPGFYEALDGLRVPAAAASRGLPC